MIAGNRGEALVHRQMLPGAGRQHNDLERGGRYGGEAEGGGVDFCGRLKCGPREYRKLGTRQGDHSNSVDGRPRISFGLLPPSMACVLQVSEDVSGGEAGEVSAVQDGLHPGI